MTWILSPVCLLIILFFILLVRADTNRDMGAWKDWLDQIGEDEKAEMEEGFILVEWGEVVLYKEVMATMKRR